MGIFSKLFVAIMAHIIMENADEKIKLLFICFQLKIVDIVLSFFLLASLYYGMSSVCLSKYGAWPAWAWAITFNVLAFLAVKD